MKIRGLGPKRIGLIAKALESMGVIRDAGGMVGMKGSGSLFKSETCSLHIDINQLVYPDRIFNFNVLLVVTIILEV